MTIDRQHTSLFVGHMFTQIPGEIDSSRSAELWVEEQYNAAGLTEEMRQRLKDANMKWKHDVNLLEDVVLQDNFKSQLRRAYAIPCYGIKELNDTFAKFTLEQKTVMETANVTR